jgi:RimJ/RimL family protein N-acetyltransferase
MRFALHRRAHFTEPVTTPSLPPEQIECSAGVLSRNRESDGPAIGAAVGDSLDTLRPWLPWASEAAAEPAAQIERSRDIERLWERGSDFVYVLRRAEGPDVIGLFGLHKRIGPDAIELGYWMHQAHTGHGYATEAARVLTETALALPDIDRIEIHTDEANAASSAIPSRLGYRLDRVVVRTPEASGESGRLQYWMLP